MMPSIALTALMMPAKRGPTNSRHRAQCQHLVSPSLYCVVDRAKGTEGTLLRAIHSSPLLLTIAELVGESEPEGPWSIDGIHLHVLGVTRIKRRERIGEIVAVEGSGPCVLGHAYTGVVGCVARVIER